MTPEELDEIAADVWKSLPLVADWLSDEQRYAAARLIRCRLVRTKQYPGGLLLTAVSFQEQFARMEELARSRPPRSPGRARGGRGVAPAGA